MCAPGARRFNDTGGMDVSSLSPMMQGGGGGQSVLILRAEHGEVHQLPASAGLAILTCRTSGFS